MKAIQRFFTCAKNVQGSPESLKADAPTGTPNTIARLAEIREQQFFPPEEEEKTKKLDDTLYVISVISNPKEFKRRYELAFRFIEHILSFKVKLILVECQLIGHAFHIPYDPSRYTLYRVQNSSELWIKENMINLALSRLPASAQYVSWIDADLEFINLRWVEDTVKALQTSPIVQLFQTCADLGPTGQIIAVHKSFGYCHDRRWKFTNCYGNKMLGVNFHTGYAWAARVETMRQLGGVFERAILGSGDHHMACAFINKIGYSIPKEMNAGYINAVGDWAKNAFAIVRGKVGYVPGTLLHIWHGKKADRRYRERWSILKDHKFDPWRHVVKNVDGIFDWSAEAPEAFRLEMSDYFSQRNEDGMEL
jgi:hypothetical protein